MDILSHLHLLDILLLSRIIKLPCRVDTISKYHRGVRIQCKTLQMSITTEKFKMDIYCITPSKPIPFSNIDLFSPIDKILTINNSDDNLRMDRMVVIEFSNDRRRILIDNHVSWISEDTMLDCNCMRGRRLKCEKINDTTYYNATLCQNRFCQKKRPKLSQSHRVTDGDILVGEMSTSGGVIPVIIQSRYGNFLYVYNKSVVRIGDINDLSTADLERHETYLMMSPELLHVIRCYNTRRRECDVICNTKICK